MCIKASDLERIVVFFNPDAPGHLYGGYELRIDDKIVSYHAFFVGAMRRAGEVLEQGNKG